MNLLVIPDIHNRWQIAEDAITRVKNSKPVTKIIFLGDYFDSYEDIVDKEKVTGTARWLKQSLAQPGRVHLLGNHDMPYVFGYATTFLYCPGYTEQKNMWINDILTDEDYQKLKLCHYEKGMTTLFSHAGMNPALIPARLHDSYPHLNELGEVIEEHSKQVLDQVRSGIPHPWVLAGYRMGEARVGGLTWAHWPEEFEPIADMHQIVGHTRGSQVEVWDDYNYKIDTSLEYVLYVNDQGGMEFIKT